MQEGGPPRSRPHSEAGDGGVALGNVVLCNSDVTKGPEDDSAMAERGCAEEVTAWVAALSGSPRAAPERYAQRRPEVRAAPLSGSPRAAPPSLFPGVASESVVREVTPDA